MAVAPAPHSDFESMSTSEFDGAPRKDLSVTEKQSRWMDEVMNTKNCMSHELSLSMEIISRNESVIDKHFLWEELLLMNATPIR
jgi:hypothetical protein